MLVERIGRPYPCPRDTASFELARKRPLSSVTAPYPRIRLYTEDTADTAGRCKGGAETSSLCPHPSPFNLGADTGWDTLQIRWICHNRMWRITSSSKHSTVWDGNETLVDLNFQAMGSRAACTIVTPFDSCKQATREVRQPNHSLQSGSTRTSVNSPYYFLPALRPRRNARSIPSSTTSWIFSRSSKAILRRAS
jgi:hypothetical protein